MQTDRNTHFDFPASPHQPSGQAPACASPASAHHAPVVRQPWGRLLKAVLDLAGEGAELLRHTEQDWTSATFVGSRHTIVLGFAGASAAEAGEHFIAALPDHEFAIPRYLIADAQILAVNDIQLPERKLVVDARLLLLDRA